MLFAGCEERESIGDKLTDAERQYLRERAARKCVAESAGNYEAYYKASGTNMTSYRRNQTWKFEYKKDDTIIETSYFYVWKVSAPYVYLRMKMTESGTTTNRFVKLDTSSNEDMALNLQYHKCSKTTNYTVADSSSVINLTISEPISQEDADTKSSSETEYRHSSIYPLYLGSLDRKKTKKIYDNNETLTKTEVFDYVVTAVNDVVQPVSFNDATISNREYCVVKYTAPRSSPYETFNTYLLPFKLDCSTSETNGPDANGDLIEDFDPATELLIF